jgi:succinate--hydroxymethylglutarate CoA-transferase
LAEQGLERPDLASDPRFSTNDARVAHRAELVKIISDALMQEDGDYWLQQLTGLG